jgi:DNA polymerase II large subunit
MHQYFKEIENKTEVAYSIAQEARTKGLDPVSVVEIPLATSLAKRVTGLVSTKYPQMKDEKIEKEILELEKKYGVLDHAVALKLSEDIANEKFCKFRNKLEAIDAGIRAGITYVTLGVVSTPLEGFTGIKLRKTKKGEDYFAAFFSGPIRSAGTTAAAFSLLLIDYLRRRFGYAKYDPNEEEIKRIVTELYDFHERVTNLQYLPSEKEAKFLAKNIPIQVDGEPSEKREVSNYKDLIRVETNFLRSGFCLIMGEGIAQKAAKLLKIVNDLKKKGFEFPDWEWLQEYVNIQSELKKKKPGTTSTYIKDIVAGRPVLTHPSRAGGFRLRYGRTRVTGFSAMAIHPLTMAVMNDFIATGTQLRTEKPGKSTTITNCDTIEPPIVKLKNGNVVKTTEENIEKIKKDIKEILYLGDLLISYGDFYNRNQQLLPPGYCSDWWLAELKEIAVKYSDPEVLKGKTEVELEEIKELLSNLDKKIPSIKEAIKISSMFSVPLHSDYIFFWSQINKKQFLDLLNWIDKGKIIENKIILPYSSRDREKQDIKDTKRVLELLGIEHEVATADIVLDEENSSSLLLNLGFDLNKKIENEDIKRKIKEIEKSSSEKVLELINLISTFKIKDKAGSFIGARMGRPEKAKPRELTGSPHVLFPIGEEGGRFRSFQSALEKGSVKSDFPLYYCKDCKKQTIYFVCERCGNKTEPLYYCSKCDKNITGENCPIHGKCFPYSTQRLDIKHYFNTALKNLNFQGELPKLIKGVRGTSSQNHVPENCAKGIVRACYNLHVNKDGTIRYDAIELPITQFKPKEIGTSIEKLKELGYKKDMFGKELKNNNQILELKPHDVLLPAAQNSPDERADDVFLRITQFVDDLLVNFYKLKPFFNAKSKEDLIGHLVACIAPHNCAAVIGRIIGFTNTQGFFASPYIHAAMRRDCDGDEAAIMLLLDCLINFSRYFLPDHRGGKQDAPLVLNSRIKAGEVDDQIMDFDVVNSYPLEFYMAAEKAMMPHTVEIDQIRNRIKEKDVFAVFKNLYYTHSVEDINNGPSCSSYKTLVTMQDKVNQQMALAEKIRAVDTSDVARLVIERHFIRDIKGNFRKFTQQQFRCVQCNEKYRRPPLVGKCLRCGGRIIFTIAEGSIVKYLEPAIGLAKKYNVSNYIRQSLDLVKLAIESVFGRETEKQQELKQWF